MTPRTDRTMAFGMTRPGCLISSPMYATVKYPRKS